MLRFSAWQINRLRDCLRAYQKFGYDEQGRYYTWRDVREAIAVFTGEEIGGTGPDGVRRGAERLRQFVEGNKDKNNPGQRKYPVPQASSLKAIYEFVTDEEINLLRKEELEEYKPDYQAPLRLLEYLDQRPDEQRISHVGKLEGIFESVMENDDRQARRIYELSQPSDEGMIEVREMEIFYDGDDLYQTSGGRFNHLLVQREHAERASRQEHRGWAILTPENNLLMFLKNTRNRKNRYYFTLGTDIDAQNDEYASKLAFLQHEMPIGMHKRETSQYFKDIIAQDVSRRIIVLSRKGYTRSVRKPRKQLAMEKE